jgi:hypothetical protein
MRTTSDRAYGDSRSGVLLGESMALYERLLLSTVDKRHVVEDGLVRHVSSGRP